jgi:23S rRNA (adenine2503-C2)-methyltransferase
MRYAEKFLQSIHEKPYRISQLQSAYFKELLTSFQDITVFSQDLRNLLEKHLPFFPLSVFTESLSSDGTYKIIFQAQDRHKIEAVLMRHHNERNTVCVSCQVGCAVNCSFCSTGKLGLKRNLTSDEIMAQILFFARYLQEKEQQKITNIVFMGMGEPFHNYDEVMKTVYDLHHQKKFGLGMRHITISTSGIIPYIEKFTAEDLQVNLAVSLHAPEQGLRERIMPIAKQYLLPDLMKSLDAYTKKTNRRIFYEYIMLHKVNDSEKEAKALAQLLKNRLSHVNLIPYNPFSLSLSEFSYKASDEKTMRKFQKILLEYGIPSTIRVTLGQDIAGACGQLALQHTL